MKNLKELLVFRIEQALDEGLAKHITITSDYLADKLIASFAEDENVKQLERHQVAIELMNKADEHSDDSAYTSAVEMASDMLLDPVKHLTPDELRQAYYKQEHLFDIDNILNELDIANEDYSEKFKIDRFPVTDEELERMAKKFRKKLDFDCNADFEYAVQSSISDVLCQRYVDEEAVFLPGVIHGCKEQIYIITDAPESNDGKGSYDIKVCDYERLLKLYDDAEYDATKFFEMMPEYFQGEWYYENEPFTDFDKAHFLLGRDGDIEDEMRFIIKWAMSEKEANS